MSIDPNSFMSVVNALWNDLPSAQESKVLSELVDFIAEKSETPLYDWAEGQGLGNTSE